MDTQTPSLEDLKLRINELSGLLEIAHVSSVVIEISNILRAIVLHLEALQAGK